MTRPLGGSPASPRFSEAQLTPRSGGASGDNARADGASETGDQTDGESADGDQSGSSDESEQSEGGDAARRLGAITQWMLRGTDLGEDVADVEAAGLQGLGLRIDQVEQYGPAKAIERLASSRLEVTSLDWITNFTGFNKYGRDLAHEEGRRAIRLAERLGAKVITVITGPQHNHTRRQVDRCVVDSLQTLGAIAADYGVSLAVMPMRRCCREEWTYLHTIPATIDLLERVGLPSVGMAFHSFHLGTASGLPSHLARAAEWIRLVRLADWSRDCRHENDQRFPGEGLLPLGGMISLLDRCGYRGDYEVDAWSGEVWRQDRSVTLAETKQFCQSYLPTPSTVASEATVPAYETVLQPAWSPTAAVAEER